MHILRRNNHIKIGNARLFASEIEIYSRERDGIFLFVILTLRQNSGRKGTEDLCGNSTRSLKAMSYQVNSEVMENVNFN